MMKNLLVSIFNTFTQSQIECKKEGLLVGKGGLVLFLLCYSKYADDNKSKSIGNEILDKLLSAFQNEKFPLFTFCDGLSGIGFALEKLSKEGLIKDDPDTVLSDVDLYLKFQLRNMLSLDYYDFLYGYIGIGLYFNSRKEQTLEVIEIINKLHASADASNKTLKWKSQNFKTGTFKYNIGLSHGIPSIVVFLSKVLKNYSIDNNSCNLIQGAVNYILAQEIDKDAYGSFFPDFAIESSKIVHKSRLAWCYGDLGIAMALWQAGVALQNEQWKTKALEILLYAAERRRDLEKESVADAGLCHGTSGIAHIFYRMWWNTRLPELKQAADYWFSKTLKMARFEDGLAGYKAWHTEKYGGWKSEYGILEGVAGIGLALLSYITETEPTWDECLLLS